MTSLIRNLKRHYLDGFCLDDDLSLDEKSQLMQGRNPSPLVKLTWVCDDISLGLVVRTDDGRSSISISKLPDLSGFISFEKEIKPDNCLLLDAYGKERMRLPVPWQLTKQSNPESAKPPTSFANIGHPCINPADGKPGQFGVTAWVEHAGMYYFELDYQAGKFLWGREIRD